MTSWIEIRGRWWIPLTKGQWYVALWCFVCYRLNRLLNNQSICRWFHTPWRSYDVNALLSTSFFPGILKPDDPEITHEVRSLWIRRYMERKYELMGKDPKSIPDLVLEKSGVEQELFAVVNSQFDWPTFSTLIIVSYIAGVFLLVCCPVLICLLSLKQIFLFEMRPPSFKQICLIPSVKRQPFSSRLDMFKYNTVKPLIYGTP